MLAEIAGRSIHLKFLPQAIRKNLDLRADGALVIVQPLKRKTQGIILVSALITKQHRRTVILRDEQIDRTIVVIIAHYEGARLFTLNFVEPDIGADIFPTIRTKIAKQSDLTL